MLANQIERDVYVLQNAYQQPIPYVRFTNAIPIVFNFRDYDIPEGSTVKAFCAKPSGAAVYSDAVLSGNTVTINVTDQMFIELGETILQVQVLNGDSTLVTFGWPVIVQPNATEGDIPPSQNESGFWNELQQQVTDAVNNCDEAAASVNTAISNAEQATQTANNAAANANEAAQQVFDQQYILTTDYTFPESGTVQPTSYGNAIVQEIDGAIYQGAAPSPNNPQFIHGVGDTGFFDGELLQGYYNSSGVFTSSSNYVCSSNQIPCVENDNIGVILENSATGVIISFFQEGGTFISQSSGMSAVAPANTAYCMISINQNGITPQTAGHITVTINGNYAVILDTVGKNLFDIDGEVNTQGSDYSIVKRNTVSGNVLTCNGNSVNNISTGQVISGLKGKTITFSAKVLSIGTGVYGAIYVYENGQYTNYKSGNTAGSKISLSMTCETDNPVFAFNTGAGTGAQFTDIQVEISETATDYIPYQSSRTYIPISSPLYSGDKIYQKEMRYRVSRQWGVAVFDGSRDEIWYFYQASGINQFYIDLSTSLHSTKSPNAFCKYFKPIVIDYRKDNYNTIYTYGGGIAVNVSTDIAKDTSEWKTWLQSNPITVVYQLATPTDEPLSQDGIIAAYSLMACDEVTNVSLTGADPNLTLNNIVKFPRNSDGALLTTTRANGVMIELKDQNEDLTTITQQIATLNQFMASFDGKTLYTT